MKIILGINAYHADSSACLIIDGKLIAAISEERLTRNKRDSSFPVNAIKLVLELGNLKYEDLETDKYETFRDIIVFTNTLLNNSDGVDKIKLERAIETTNFNVLKNKEKNEGFEEALYSEDSGEKKIFFNKGFNNRWKKILREDIRKKLEDVFKNEMKDIGYI